MKKNIFYIVILIFSVNFYSCSNQQQDKNLVQKNVSTNEVRDTSLNIISLGTSEELTQKIKELHQVGGIDTLIDYFQNLALNSNSLININNQTHQFQGIRIYTLTPKGNDTNQLIYESPEINSNKIGVCFSYRETFKNEANYNLVIYESL